MCVRTWLGYNAMLLPFSASEHQYSRPLWKGSVDWEDTAARAAERTRSARLRREATMDPERACVATCRGRGVHVFELLERREAQERGIRVLMRTGELGSTAPPFQAGVEYPWRDCEQWSRSLWGRVCYFAVDPGNIPLTCELAGRGGANLIMLSSSVQLWFTHCSAEWVAGAVLGEVSGSGGRNDSFGGPPAETGADLDCDKSPCRARRTDCFLLRASLDDQPGDQPCSLPMQKSSTRTNTCDREGDVLEK